MSKKTSVGGTKKSATTNGSSAAVVAKTPAKNGAKSTNAGKLAAKPAAKSAKVASTPKNGAKPATNGAVRASKPAAKTNGAAKAAPKPSLIEMAPPATGDLDAIRIALQASQVDYPRPDAKLEAALRARFSDDQCRALGERTRAVKVLQQLVTMLASAKSAKTHGVLPGYSDARLGLLVAIGRELVPMLAASRADTRASAGAGAAAKAAIAVATKQQQKATAKLVAALASFAGERAEEIAALAIARKRNEKSGADAVGPLAELARKWMARKDDVSHHLAKDAGLSEAVVDDALAAAAALAAAVASKAKRGGAALTADPPAVNVIEGRVVYELRALWAALNDARAANGKVERPYLEPSLRNVIGPRATAPAAKKPAPAPSPTAAANA